MASTADILNLRRIAPVGNVDDIELAALIDTKGINGAAADLWNSQASATATLVDITESGSSRKNSQIHDNAKSMARYYGRIYDAELAEAASTRGQARTRAMRR